MFISPVTSFNDTRIYFAPGNGRDFSSVPLIPAGRFTRNASIAIQITAVMNRSMLNERDRDPNIGITVGNLINMFWIADINNYPWSAPCNLNNASKTLSKIFRTGPVPDQFTFKYVNTVHLRTMSSTVVLEIFATAE